MWKHKLGVLLTASFIAFFLWLTFPTQGKDIKTVTTCETINKELKAYRLYGITNGFFVDYFFKCKPYEMIQ